MTLRQTLARIKATQAQENCGCGGLDVWGVPWRAHRPVVTYGPPYGYPTGWPYGGARAPGEALPATVSIPMVQPLQNIAAAVPALGRPVARAAGARAPPRAVQCFGPGYCVGDIELTLDWSAVEPTYGKIASGRWFVRLDDREQEVSLGGGITTARPGSLLAARGPTVPEMTIPNVRLGTYNSLFYRVWGGTDRGYSFDCSETIGPVNHAANPTSITLWPGPHRCRAIRPPPYGGVS